MRNLNLNNVTTSVGMPLKSGSLKHIQLAYKEALDALGKLQIGNLYDETKGYILYGCVNSGAGSNYVISAGAMFYNGEIYLVDAATFTTSGGNVPVCTVTTTYYTGTDADTVEFTDSVTRSIHEIRKIVIASGASGSGTFNFANAIVVKKGWVKNATGITSDVVSSNVALNSIKYDYYETVDTVTLSVRATFTASANITETVLNIGLPTNLRGTTKVYSAASYISLASGNAYLVKETTDYLIQLLFKASISSGSSFDVFGQITYPK